ncbi:MAG: DNA-3-methyladenine glycosylase family protein [Steroidobacteraceae bacterium]
MSEHIINHLSGIDSTMGGLIRAVGAYGLVLEAECHPFEALARAIAHQQLHGAAARTILARFVNTVGNGAFPTPQAVIAAPIETLRAVGFSFSKIAALRDLATKTTAGIVPDRATLVRLEDAEIITRLTEVRGIGRWTVEMLLMFHLGRADILPVDDFGVRTGFQFTYGLRKMPAPKALAAYGERWGPHRSAAAWYLWRAVELKRAGKLPAPLEQIRLPRVLRLRRRPRVAAAKSKNTKPVKALAKAAARKPGAVTAEARRKAAATAPRPRRSPAKKTKSKRGRK